MSYFIIFGVRSTKLKEQRLNSNTICPNCGEKDSFIVKGKANYVHLFWIPIIPLAKQLYVQCTNCGQQYAQKDFPEDVKQALKQNPVRRPILHLVVPIVLLVKIVSAILLFGYFFAEDVVQEAKHEKKREERALKVKDLNEVFANDKKSMQLTPSFAEDSISYKLKQGFPFEEYNLKVEEVALFTKIEGSKLLLLADIKESGKFAEAGGCVFVNSLKNYIIESAPKKQYDFYVALFENDVLKMIHTPQHPYETEYQSTVPLHGFYDDNFYYKNSGDRIRDNVKKQQLIALRSKKEATTPKVDAEKIQSAFKKVTDKFKFSYREYPVSAKESIANECKFTLETGNELPEEIRAMLKMFNGNGPFLNWNFISSKTKKIHKAYKNASMNELTVYGKTKAGKLLPVANSPYWIAFYQDNVYTYAVDLLPGANGEVGQVILLQKNKRPQYVAKNIESFLKLYLDEKVLTDLTDWQ